MFPFGGHANAIVVGGMGHERNLVIDTRLEDFTPVTNIKGEINREGLLDYYRGNDRTLEGVTEHIAAADPLHIATDTKQPMYAYKVKQFLLAFALGMTCSTPWYGTFHANGGYIIVKEDGDVLCYHFFDRNDLEDYLYFNTRYEPPSTTRHCFGEIYQENGGCFLKLNLQVRFK